MGGCLLASYLLFRKDTQPLREGGGWVKPPEPLSKNTLFFLQRKQWKKKHEPLRSRVVGCLGA